ncbi:YebC/PmpR family DNA-binding transcriptional regulator [bacterium]|nr:YebC/PmpR family DNA-binding transcriptional regulator [bacterium]
MSGHSKWASIKHKKAAVDAKRGKLFTRLIREITVAAKEGGGDPDGNPRLRMAIADAKAANMPSDNIDKAVKRGTGDLPGVQYEEVTYEGYGPAGVAVIVETFTDNKKRTVADIRHIFSKYNGNLGETGCVGWMFDRKGIITILKEDYSEEELLEKVLAAGVEDITEDSEIYEIYTSSDGLQDVREKFDEMQIKYDSAELGAVPKSYVKVEDKKALQVLKLVEALEELDDVKSVFSNFDIDDKIIDEFNS